MARQRLGQHFLASAAWRERIARLALDGAAQTATAAGAGGMGEPRGHGGGLWIEIGAGHGEMTALLAREAERVIAVELDARLLPRLQEQTATLQNVEIVAGDILAVDLSALAGAERFRVYGNLPYYITSPIVHRLMEHADQMETAFLVVQLEVAERLAARPGSRDYGYFSAFTQFYAKPEILLRIPPGAFQPPPKVASALVALRLPGERTHLGIGSEQEAEFMGFLKICFAQKRKTLRNNLRVLLSPEQASEAIGRSGMAASVRAEEMNLTAFARLFAMVEAEKRGEARKRKRS